MPGTRCSCSTSPPLQGYQGAHQTLNNRFRQTLINNFTTTGVLKVAGGSSGMLQIVEHRCEEKAEF